MTDCYEEQVVQAIVALLQAAMDAAYGVGHTVVRDYPAFDPDQVDSAGSPFVYCYEPSSDFDKSDEDYLVELKNLLVSGLVRCTAGFTSTMQGQANNLQHVLMGAVLYNSITVGNGVVQCILAAPIMRQQGENHMWVDLPLIVRIPRRD